VPSRRGDQNLARGRGEWTRHAKLETEAAVMQLEASGFLAQAAGVSEERAAEELARGRAMPGTVGRVAHNTRLQQTLPRLRAAAAEP